MASPPACGVAKLLVLSGSTDPRLRLLLFHLQVFVIDKADETGQQQEPQLTYSLKHLLTYLRLAKRGRRYED